MHAQQLWGDDFIAPMSEVFGISRRTIERWKAGRGEPPASIREDMARLARRAGVDARTMGAILRRYAGGATRQDVEAEIMAMRRCLAALERDRIIYTLPATSADDTTAISS